MNTYTCIHSENPTFYYEIKADSLFVEENVALFFMDGEGDEKDILVATLPAEKYVISNSKNIESI